MKLGQLKAASALAVDRGVYVYQILPVRSYLAAILSDDTLRLVDGVTLQETRNSPISNVHAGVTIAQAARLQGSSEMLITAGRDAVVKSWDLISGAQSISFQDGSSTPYLSLDCNDSYVAAGSELTNHEAAVSIWQVAWTKRTKIRADSQRRDYRNPARPIRKYVESHSDDVTELAFHPSKSNVLLSGSTDSLINLYDTNVVDEDDALIQITNHGSSVHHADFLSNDTFFGLSHDEMFSLYDFSPSLQQHEGAETTSDLALGDLREKLNCEYVVDVMNGGDGRNAVVAVGSHSNQYLDLVPLAQHTPSASQKFDQASTVRLEGAHGLEIVRSVCFADDHDDVQEEIIYTAGEDGCIKAWRVDFQPAQMETGDEQKLPTTTTPTTTKKTTRKQEWGEDEEDKDRESGYTDSAQGVKKSRRFKPY